MQMEEAELRSLRIPSSAHRGYLSPSKHSFLPTLQEQTQERTSQLSQWRTRSVVSNTRKEAEDQRQSPRREAPQDQQLLAGISADTLESIKADFIAGNGSLTLGQFTKAMLRNVSIPGDAERRTKRSKSMTSFFQDCERRNRSSSLGSTRGRSGVAETHRDGAGVPSSRTEYAAAVAELFRRVDVHDEGSITWDEVSDYFIDQGVMGSDESIVDNIKTYEVSTTHDVYKHENIVEKLVYLEPPIDSIACFSRDSKSFRLYSATRLVKTDVHGHRGAAINCCYVDTINQIATTAADMTICLWDAASTQLRSRISAKDVQLCVQWDSTSESLFSGAIDGTLSCWDIQGPALKDCKRSPSKTTINDLLMVPDLNMLASAYKDECIWLWDIATMKPTKPFRGNKKGTFSLAYSTEYRCLLTAGLGQEALVWNPYVEQRPIFRLKGHTHALAGVSVVPGTPQILTADFKGTFRLWDMRNFRCVQSFGGAEKAEKSDLNTFCTIPHHKRVAAGSSRIKLFDYTAETGGESVTDSVTTMHATEAQRPEEASRPVRQLSTEESRGPQLPRLSPESPPERAGSWLTVVDLDTSDSKRRKPKPDPDASWKAVAERILSDPGSEEADFHNLYRQMEKHGSTDDLIPGNLVRHAYTKKVAPYVRHRASSLSKQEASAADRLANAMQALGADDHGVYGAMAKSLHPGARPRHKGRTLS